MSRTGLFTCLFGLSVAACSNHATESVSETNDSTPAEAAQVPSRPKRDEEPKPALEQPSNHPRPISQRDSAGAPANTIQPKAANIPVPATPVTTNKPDSPDLRRDTATPAVEPPPTRVGSAYDLPAGGSVTNLAEKVETALQLIDGLGIEGLEHVARMKGDAADETGNTRVDLAGEKARYVRDLEGTYLSLRIVMADVARCPNQSPAAPTMNADSPVNRIKAEIDRYRAADATGREADAHKRALEPVIMRFKSIQPDVSNLLKAGQDPSYPVPPEVRANWCGR
jgi:hypothetical protein